MHSEAFWRNLLSSSFVVLLVGASSVTAEQFNPLHHSGPASPYFAAPPLAGVPSTVPDGCVVDQAAWLLRHGSRYLLPGTRLFHRLGDSFCQVPKRYLHNSSLVNRCFCRTGAGEAFALGVKLRKRYGFTKGGENITVWSAGQQRVVDTATYFTRGYLSAGNYLTTPSLNRGTPPPTPLSLTPLHRPLPALLMTRHRGPAKSDLEWVGSGSDGYCPAYDGQWKRFINIERLSRRLIEKWWTGLIVLGRNDSEYDGYRSHARSLRVCV
ncbi:phosphoglycerate mutase-like protein [Dendrothele bispora CBS 962.96]|uniref:Phosphoglycerate mutase-like protein n=1 Tax=Dendrothele bispora (strain CBS 962.96) TaxID=1314807 RepID=A0A4S8M3T3_DENBC|nr:phosphoglycerate mutase-like protein [Dendrothele bispora CBS 962.96]